MRMRGFGLALPIGGLSIIAGAVAAQPVPAEQGRAVINCQVDDQRRLGACQVTFQDHPDLRLGDLAQQWAAGKILPPLAEGQKGAPVVDLGLCFAIAGQPPQASLDLSAPCAAIAKASAPYGLADIIDKPKAAKLSAPGAPLIQRVNREDLLKTGTGDIRSALSKMPVAPFNPSSVNLSCSVLTSGALICQPAPPGNVNPARVAAALDLARQVRVKVKQVNGLPAVGTLNFSITP